MRVLPFDVAYTKQKTRTDFMSVGFLLVYAIVGEQRFIFPL